MMPTNSNETPEKNSSPQQVDLSEFSLSSIKQLTKSVKSDMPMVKTNPNSKKAKRFTKNKSHPLNSPTSHLDVKKAKLYAQNNAHRHYNVNLSELQDQATTAATLLLQNSPQCGNTPTTANTNISSLSIDSNNMDQIRAKHPTRLPVDKSTFEMSRSFGDRYPLSVPDQSEEEGVY